MKQYLVSYAINHFDRPMFYNEIVRLINFWQI